MIYQSLDLKLSLEEATSMPNHWLESITLDSHLAYGAIVRFNVITKGERGYNILLEDMLSFIENYGYVLERDSLVFIGLAEIWFRNRKYDVRFGPAPELNFLQKAITWLYIWLLRLVLSKKTVDQLVGPKLNKPTKPST